MSYQLNPLVKEVFSPAGVVNKVAKVANFATDPVGTVVRKTAAAGVNKLTGGKMKPVTKLMASKNAALTAAATAR